jgi:hypothetical protein
VPERIRQLGDPWATIDDEPNSLEPLLDGGPDQGQQPVDAVAPVYPKMEGEPPRVAFQSGQEEVNGRRLAAAPQCGAVSSGTDCRAERVGASRSASGGGDED